MTETWNKSRQPHRYTSNHMVAFFATSGTVYTVHYTVYSVLCTMYSLARILRTSHIFTPYTVHCTAYIVQRTAYIASYETYTCTLYSVQRTVYDVHCTPYSVQCIVKIPYTDAMLEFLIGQLCVGCTLLRLASRFSYSYFNTFSLV